MHRARFGYQLRKGESATQAAARFGGHGQATPLEGGAVTVVAELDGEPMALWDGEGSPPAWLGRL